MTLSIRDAATDRLVRALAKRKGIGLTDAVRLAVGNELDRLDQEQPLRERVAAIRRAILARGRTGERADKAFFDDLSGDL
jgi:antitoxin VapB